MASLERKKVSIALLTEVSTAGMAEKYEEVWGPYRIFGSGKVAIAVYRSLLIGGDGRQIDPPVLRYGSRVAGVFVQGTWVVAVYQPTGAGAAVADDKEAYFTARNKMLSRTAGVRTIIGGDHNAALQRLEQNDDLLESGAIGQAMLLRGAAGQNGQYSQSGRENMAFCATNGFWIPDTFKSMRSRGTWRHPTTRQWYELDYFMLSHQLSAGRIWTEGPGFRTDHRMKLMYIQLSASGRQARYVRKLAQGSEGRQEERIPFKAIRGDPALAQQYAAETDASYRRLVNTGLHPAGTEIHEPSALGNRWYNMRKAMTAAAEKIVPPAQERRASGYPPWANVASAERFREKKRELLDQRLVQGVSPAEVTRLNGEVRRMTVPTRHFSG